MIAPQIAITGADGFIGRNLSVRLAELDMAVLPLTRSSRREDWYAAAATADAIVHLAGANRPTDAAEFLAVNCGTAELLAAAIIAAERPVKVIYTSSSRAAEDTDYGRSKLAGEQRLAALAAESGSPVHTLRLPNVFGKWARPNYNSAVATFCHNIARDLPIRVDDPTAPLSLVYIDDLVETIVALIAADTTRRPDMIPRVYETTVGEVADTIVGFRKDRANNMIDNVGVGLKRALYSTYVSALPIAEFSYPIAAHEDARGSFSEMLKTRTSGQFSYFTAHPGVTRGGHYHHTKTEKFLVVHGRARFRFRHIVTGEVHEIEVAGERPEVVETVPGWAHDITNVGEDVLISMLWANEIFELERPDTIAART